MLEQAIEDIVCKQRPYYLLQGNPIKGVDNQYWLIFKHRDADNLLHNFITFLGIGDRHAPEKLLRLDPKNANIFEYTPLQEGNLPSATLLRTSKLNIIEKFLKKESVAQEKSLLKNNFRELKGCRRKFNLPDELDKYHPLISNILERAKIYRRSTGYFDSDILKLYQQPLQQIVQTGSQIRLLMDWMGFTKKRDIKELEKLQNPYYRAEFTQRTLEKFLQGLSDNAFSGTEIMAELVRLGFLRIKLVKMDLGRAIYHKKTGIFTDALENHILHEGSDNFTVAAHSRNAESVTFFYSWESLDSEAINNSIRQFDAEWQRKDITFDISQDFLQQVRKEHFRRFQAKQPTIESINPDRLTPGETTTVEITGTNLDKVEEIQVKNDQLVKVDIDRKKPESIVGKIKVHPDRPPTKLNNFRVKTSTGSYNTSPKKAVSVSKSLEIPEYPEIPGFKQAVEIILAGKHGTPKDFQYWLAQQRPHQFQVESSDLLDRLVYQNILFEHQKSGAQHCLRVMQGFGVAVCADAVGLGKTRLAAAVAKLYQQDNTTAKIAIIAAKKLFPNWEREMAELGFKSNDYELYNKNLMSRKGNNFLTDFNRYGGPDLVIIDEAHEGIRNYRNRIHKTCLQVQEQDRKVGKQRHFLLLTATPWNNRREDIYNILSPFLNRPQGFKELGFQHELVGWFQNRETGIENFTDNTELFRRTYRELFLQRTRKMLRDATPDLNLYAKRVAQWLPVKFEPATEQALDQIFTQFEDNLYIPFSDPIRYLTSNVEQRSLLGNQRRFFLQRAESSMYALRRTIKTFGDKIRQLQQRLEAVSPDADGLKEFLLIHYRFQSENKTNQNNFLDLDDKEVWDEDYEEEEEEEENNQERQQKRQKLLSAIDTVIDKLRQNKTEAQRIYHKILADCEDDLEKLEQIQNLLSGEFVRDHKREEVTNKVKELIAKGHKVLLISTFSDTVIDYYHYMTRDSIISHKGIAIAIGATKYYYPNNSTTPKTFKPHNIYKDNKHKTGVKRNEVFQLFAPVANCKNPEQRPNTTEQISVLIGSETLSVGQNLQDADYLINIDLPWNPMILEQRIGRIDRPKQHHTENIYIYYANSENQLLRQASRLANLNKKLVGELNQQDGKISLITKVDNLGASIYGDTLFDDEVLPGYINFLNSLVKARKLEQNNLQEEAYTKQETSSDLYTQNEVLYAEELSKLLKELGEDYQANPITLGRHNGEKEEPSGLIALTVEYFGPNGEPIPKQTQTIFWNDQTAEKDGYGIAIATAFKTRDAGDIFSTKYLMKNADKLYKQLIEIKRNWTAELKQEETLENLNITSERINSIKKRLKRLDTLPEGLKQIEVKDTIKKLSSWKDIKQVQKLLREYTEGSQNNLDDKTFIVQLVRDTDKLSLLPNYGIKATSLKVSLAAILMRV
ncbi:MAG: helicase-related protein [Mastigocoleus sp. MO_167.B18]|nr:helicase-related protein [Mastigocoleus sp. MO_167.B18]